MHLILFDIDGTLIDSTRADDACFIQTFDDLYKINLSGVDWNSFPHVTDSGLTREIFNRNFQRAPKPEEVNQIKQYFYSLLESRKKDFVEIEGALALLESLDQSTKCRIAFATGGWKETALLKMSTIGLDMEKYLLVSSNDHFDRAEITQRAIELSIRENAGKKFESITYVGDGLWDLKTANHLGIAFIGIDYSNNQKLKDAGAKYVIRNFKEWETIATFDS